jgi:hypothetical protein
MRFGQLETYLLLKMQQHSRRKSCRCCAAFVAGYGSQLESVRQVLCFHNGAMPAGVQEHKRRIDAWEIVALWIVVQQGALFALFQNVPYHMRPPTSCSVEAYASQITCFSERAM